MGVVSGEYAGTQRERERETEDAPYGIFREGQIMCYV